MEEKTAADYVGLSIDSPSISLPARVFRALQLFVLIYPNNIMHRSSVSKGIFIIH